MIIYEEDFENMNSLEIALIRGVDYYNSLMYFNKEAPEVKKSIERHKKNLMKKEKKLPLI